MNTQKKSINITLDGYNLSFEFDPNVDVKNPKEYFKKLIQQVYATKVTACAFEKNKDDILIDGVSIVTDEKIDFASEIRKEMETEVDKCNQSIKKLDEKLKAKKQQKSKKPVEKKPSGKENRPGIQNQKPEEVRKTLPEGFGEKAIKPSLGKQRLNTDPAEQDPKFIKI
jgi:hypothetical protein